MKKLIKNRSNFLPILIIYTVPIYNISIHYYLNLLQEQLQTNKKYYLIIHIAGLPIKFE